MYGFRKVQDSTSAITCIHYKDGTGTTDFHMDIGIIVMQDSSKGYNGSLVKTKFLTFLNESISLLVTGRE